MQETQEMWGLSLCWEDPLEYEMATHSSFLAWKIPWTEKPGGLQPMGSQRVRHDWACSHTHTHMHTHGDKLAQVIQPLNFLLRKCSKPKAHSQASSWSRKTACTRLPFPFIIIRFIVSLCVSVARSCPIICLTLWTIAWEGPLFIDFSRQEYWSRWPFPSPGDLPDPGIEPRSPALQADSLLSESPGSCNWVLIFCYTHAHSSLLKSVYSPW